MQKYAVSFAVPDFEPGGDAYTRQLDALISEVNKECVYTERLPLPDKRTGVSAHYIPETNIRVVQAYDAVCQCTRVTYSVLGKRNPEAWVPEVWAAEAQRILRENMLPLPILHRDFHFDTNLEAVS